MPPDTPSTQSEPGHGSWWPILATGAVVITLAGALVPPLLVVGALLVIGTVYGWVREDLRHPAAALPLRTRHGDRWWAVLFLILGELVLFGALFSYYFWVRDQGFPLADGATDMVLPRFEPAFVALLTGLLVTSGFTAHAAEGRLRRGDAGGFRRWLGVTVVLGFLFVAGQAYEYTNLAREAESGTYWTAFFGLTGVHGAHVAAGASILGILALLSARGRVTGNNLAGVSGAVLYWHFVDAMWLLIVAMVYLRWI